MRKTFCDRCKVEVTKEIESPTSICWRWTEGNSTCLEYADLCRPCVREILKQVGAKTK